MFSSLTFVVCCFIIAIGGVAMDEFDSQSIQEEKVLENIEKSKKVRKLKLLRDQKLLELEAINAMLAELEKDEDFPF